MNRGLSSKIGRNDMKLAAQVCCLQLLRENEFFNACLAVYVYDSSLENLLRFLIKKTLIFCLCLFCFL